MDKKEIKLLAKILKASKELEGQLEKNGKGFKHKYFRTEDILPKVLEVCDKYNIMYKECLREGSMRVVDLEEPYGELVYTLPVNVTGDDTDEKKVQLVGKKQTYYIRYLLMQVFNICEVDEIELTDPDKIVTPKKMMVDRSKKSSPLNDDEFKEMIATIKRNSFSRPTIDVINTLHSMGKFVDSDKDKLMNYFETGGVII